MLNEIFCCMKTRDGVESLPSSSHSSRHPKIPSRPFLTPLIPPMPPPKSPLRALSNMGTMKEAHIHPDTSVTIHDVHIPSITHPYHLVSSFQAQLPRLTPQKELSLTLCSSSKFTLHLAIQKTGKWPPEP
jgi:hypothetical protein